MYKAFLIKYAEIGVKGKNRDLFEEALVRQIKYALKPGTLIVYRQIISKTVPKIASPPAR